VGLGVDEADRDAAVEPEVETVLERETFGVREPVGEPEALGDGVVVRDARMEAELLPLGVEAGVVEDVEEGERVPDTEGRADLLARGLPVPVGLGVKRADADTEAEEDACVVGEREAFGDGDDEPVLDGEAVPVGDGDCEGVELVEDKGEGDRADEREADTLAVSVLEPVGDGDSEGERVALIERDGLLVPVGEALFDVVCVRVETDEAAAERVRDGFDDRDGVVVLDRVFEAVEDAEVVVVADAT